ncbi:MAG: pyridoxal phosphate-dependent aminotransferase [Blastocatellia bacterium]|nr:pyridoxal phosphate-dependent aminotransferase [Blastocatellia bacterium]MCS7157723.1 pyridoxal phosphate-dependent aminotransferase [Blastocatellia bacterium]MDW8167094.1 pyridoxal phosphate-dependent aminotransferase [Acidobacteriota bacterium]MDW8257198.1 pyridoxal phosphate-dependent aminotransferase [Acidobacteriota bacterium]
MFAARTNWPTAVNELTRRVRERRERGLPILDLTESNPTRCAFEYPDEAILAPFLFPENLRYEPLPQGARSAREAIARYYAEYGAPADPERIFLTASTSEAYAFLFRLLADPGDHLLVPRPSYPLFGFLADVNDVQLDTYRLVYREGWQIDLESVRAAFRPKTRALILVNPNNPTGSFVKRREWERLRAFCAEHHLAVISDEVFLDYAYAEDPERIGTLLREESGDILVFALGGISKLLGLPQMKLAWIGIAGPEELVREALFRLEVIGDTYLSVNTPVQQALPHWMALRRAMSRQILERVLTNRQFLEENVARTERCRCLKAEGGWYAILQLADARDDEAFALELVEREGVLVHPGYFFEFQEEGHLVLSLLPPPEVFREGVRRILRQIEGE